MFVGTSNTRHHFQQLHKYSSNCVDNKHYSFTIASFAATNHSFTSTTITKGRPTPALARTSKKLFSRWIPECQSEVFPVGPNRSFSWKLVSTVFFFRWCLVAGSGHAFRAAGGARTH